MKAARKLFATTKISEQSGSPSPSLSSSVLDISIPQRPERTKCRYCKGESDRSLDNLLQVQEKLLKTQMHIRNCLKISHPTTKQRRIIIHNLRREYRTATSIVERCQEEQLLCKTLQTLNNTIHFEALGIQININSILVTQFDANPCQDREGEMLPTRVQVEKMSNPSILI